MPSYYVASDIGGTFTDTVVIDDTGRVGRYKSSTVPDNPAEGVLNTLVDAADERGVDLAELLADVEMFAHGTTIATNAMLEGRTKKVGLIQTRGFGDTLTTMRGSARATDRGSSASSAAPTSTGSRSPRCTWTR